MKFYRLSGAIFYDCLNTIYKFIKSFLNKKCLNFTTLVLKLEQVYFTSCCGIFVCVEALRPSQPNGVMSSVVSLPTHTFTGQA